MRGSVHRPKMKSSKSCNNWQELGGIRLRGTLECLGEYGTRIGRSGLKEGALKHYLASSSLKLMVSA